MSFLKRFLIIAICVFFISVTIHPVFSQVTGGETSTPKSQNNNELINENLYDNGNFDCESEELNNKLIAIQSQGDIVEVARELSNSSLDSQKQGEWQEAKENIKKSICLLKKEKNHTKYSLRVLAQSYDIKGKIQREMGQSADALETWEKAEKIYAEIDKPDLAIQKLAIQNKINQTQAMRDLGLYPRACDTLFSVLGVDIKEIGDRLNLEIINCRSLTGLTEEESDQFFGEFIDSLNSEINEQQKFDALLSLGEVLFALGNENLAIKILEKSKIIADEKLNDEAQASSHLILGNTLKIIGLRKIAGESSMRDKRRSICKAIEEYKYINKFSEESFEHQKLRLKAQLNQLTLLSITEGDIDLWQEVRTLWESLQSELINLSPSYASIYLQTNFVHNFIKIREKNDFYFEKGNSYEYQCLLKEDSQEGNNKEISREQRINALADFENKINGILDKTMENAKKLENKRGQALILFNRSLLYEVLFEEYLKKYQQQKGEYLSNAERYTDEALSLFPRFKESESDITYQLLWQLGRIHKAQGEIEKAISDYEQAKDALTMLRKDLVSIRELQFYFKEEVEPVYRELVVLYLQFVTDELFYSNKDQQNFSTDNRTKLLSTTGKKSKPDHSNIQYVTSEQDFLNKARQVIEELQLAELNNFFREVCLENETINIDDFDPNAVVIYPIILPDSLNVIVSLPEQENKQTKSSLNSIQVTDSKIFCTIIKEDNNSNKKQSKRKTCLYTPKDDKGKPINQNQVDRVITEIQDYLSITDRHPDNITTNLQINEKFRSSARKLHRWIIEPFEKEGELKTNNINETLVFVPDGNLINIPMSVLIDEKDHDKYLIEKYPIVVSPGLQLLKPKSLPKKFKVLIAGLSKRRFYENKIFEALPSVEDFMNNDYIQDISEQLKNNQFTKKNLKNKIQYSAFPVIHLATHGVFGENFDDTFILTGDGGLNLNELNNLLRANALTNQENPIELLIMSACETATGNKQRALGMAGVALRSGSRSTIATLWQVQDDSTTKLMKEFYRKLNAGKIKLNKAEILRQAQLSLLDNKKDNEQQKCESSEYCDPHFWSAFVLLGNWL